MLFRGDPVHSTAPLFDGRVDDKTPQADRMVAVFFYSVPARGESVTNPSQQYSVFKNKISEPDVWSELLKKFWTFEDVEYNNWAGKKWGKIANYERVRPDGGKQPKISENVGFKVWSWLKLS